MLDSDPGLLGVEFEQEWRREGEASLGSRASVPKLTVSPFGLAYKGTLQSACGAGLLGLCPRLEMEDL